MAGGAGYNDAPMPPRTVLSSALFLLVAACWPRVSHAQSEAPSPVSAPAAASVEPALDCRAVVDRYFVEAVPLLLDRGGAPEARLAALRLADPCRDARLVTIWLPLADDPVLGREIVPRLATSDDPRAADRLRELLRQSRTQGRLLAGLAAGAGTASVDLLARWATDATLPRGLRLDVRDALMAADPERAFDLPSPGRPLRHLGPAWGGAVVGGSALALVGFLGQDPGLGAAIGAPLGIVVGGGTGALLSTAFEATPAQALRLGTYPTWGLLLGSGWAWAVDLDGRNNVREARFDAGLVLAGAGLGLGAAFLDRADVSPVRQAHVDYGLFGGMTLGMGAAALTVQDRAARWSLISAGTVGGGLLAALHGRDGERDVADRTALAAWPILGSGTARFLHLSSRGDRPDRGRQVWPWMIVLPSAEDAPWGGIGWGVGSLAALAAVGTPGGAPGDYAAREAAVVASAGLLGGSLLPLAANAAAWQHRHWRTAYLSGLGLHLGTAAGLAAAGAFDLPSERAGFGMVGAGWTLLAANGVDTLVWGEEAERVHASRVNTAAITAGYAAGAWLLPLVDWRGVDAGAASFGLAWGTWQGGVAAAEATTSRRRRWSGALLGAAAGSAGAAAIAHGAEADGTTVAGMGAAGLAGVALATSTVGIADAGVSVHRRTLLAVSDGVLIAAGLSLLSPAVDGRTLALGGAGAVLGSGFGALGGLMFTAETRGLSVGAATGWALGAAGGVLLDGVLDRREAARRADKRASGGMFDRLEWRGLTPLAMVEHGSGEPIPGFAVDFAVLPPPAVAAVAASGTL